MIERVTACLENGGKHVIRRISKQHTHRSLHSAFWTHGAGNINLPSWWLAFLQVPSGRDQTWSFDKCTVGVPRTAPDVFGLLDFLYPGETLAFIRKCMSGNASAVRRRRRSQLLSQRSRAYTSVADASVEIQPNQEHAAETVRSEASAEVDKNVDHLDGEAGRKLRANLKRMLRVEENPPTTRVLWEAFQEVQTTSLTLSSTDYQLLFERLRASKTPSDLNCMRNLLDAIPVPQRNYQHYNNAIFAALEQSDIEGAMRLYRGAISRSPNFHGSSKIFKYVVQNFDWRSAEEIWKQHLDSLRASVRQSNIWYDISTLPITELMAMAQAATLNAIRRAETSTLDEADVARSLAVSLMRRALSTFNVEFDVFTQRQMMETSCHLQQPDISLFKAAVLQNLSLGPHNRKHSKAALRLYREIRGEHKLVPDLELAVNMMHRFSASRNSQGMYEVLEDFWQHHGGPPRKAYSIIMPQLARQGDFDTVEELFHDFIGKYGKEDIQKLARNLFYACFRRVDAARGYSLLQSLKEAYDYEPSLEAWNTLIATYARAGDCDGAMSMLEKLMATSIAPSSTTYGILMGMYAKRSDYDTTSTLYEQAVSAGIKPNVFMVDSLVLALVSSDRFDEAYQVVQGALTIDLNGAAHDSQHITEAVTRTRMWNTLLSHCAMNRRLDKAAEIQKRMHEAGVPFDSDTYAVLMLSLCLKKMPGAALQIKNVIMRNNGVRPTVLHYSILINAFMCTNEHNKVLLLANEMLKYNIHPNFSSQNYLLRVASKVDEKQSDQENVDGQPFQARRAEEVMKQVLDNLNPKELATLGPVPGAQSNPVNVAFYSKYFSYMIYLYGKHHTFDRVVSMYDEFIETTRKIHGNTEALPPVEILSALMVAHNNAGEHTETAKCWQLAMEKSEQVACKADADTSQAGWVLHKYRFILSLPLTRYMQSLHATSRVEEIATTIDNVQRAGYQLSVHNWNKYCQILAQEGQFTPAFEVCEKNLMDDWPGWEQFGSPLRARQKIKKQWNPKSLDRGKAFPHYETLVYLAGIYLDLRARPYGTGKETVDELERLAPRTMEAVLKMPNFDDELQNRILKRNG